MSEINRRAFLKGAGKTIITGATLGAVGMSGGSTTPLKTVAPATTWKNLNVLSPKAKAYRGFLKGLIGSARWYKREGGANTKTLLTKLTNKQVIDPKTGNIKTVKTSYGRDAFETAIKKPEGSWTKMEAKQGVGNSSATNIAIDIRTDKRAIAGAGGKPKDLHGGQTRRLTAQITRGARKYHAIELKRFRLANPERMHKKVSAKIHKENVKAKSKGGSMMGGGKFIEGMETPRNPTGMSLLTRRSVLM